MALISISAIVSNIHNVYHLYVVNTNSKQKTSPLMFYCNKINTIFTPSPSLSRSLCFSHSPFPTFYTTTSHFSLLPYPLSVFPPSSLSSFSSYSLVLFCFSTRVTSIPNGLIIRPLYFPHVNIGIWKNEGGGKRGEELEEEEKDEEKTETGERVGKGLKEEIRLHQQTEQ